MIMDEVVSIGLVIEHLPGKREVARSKASDKVLYAYRIAALVVQCG